VLKTPNIVAAAAFVVLLAALQVLKPELDPSWRMGSEYAIGDYGWVMRIAFFSNRGTVERPRLRARLVERMAEPPGGAELLCLAHDRLMVGRSIAEERLHAVVRQRAASP
jgi:hypothetical protein